VSRNEFLSIFVRIFVFWLEIGARNMNMVQLKIRELREIRDRKGRVFLADSNELHLCACSEGCSVQKVLNAWESLHSTLRITPLCSFNRDGGYLLLGTKWFKILVCWLRLVYRPCGRRLVAGLLPRMSGFDSR
jgi:hypothetical protein